MIIKYCKCKLKWRNNGNKLFVKAFCEHYPIDYVRLMKTENSLGSEATNANVTSFRGLLSSVFKVKVKFLKPTYISINYKNID